MFANRLFYVLMAIALLIAACAPQDESKSNPPSTLAVQATATVPATSSPAATPKSGELLGCVPGCVRGIVKPGNLPTGEYQTQYFFGGRMQIKLSGSWTSDEDSTGGFNLSPRGSRDAIFFWEDVYPLENGVRVDGVPITAAGLLGWLSKSPRLKTTTPVAGKIGAGIPATIVDVSVPAGVKNEDPTCVGVYDVCILFLGFPQWGDQWGIAGPQVQRFYIANVSYGGVTHLFVAVIYPDVPANMDSFRAIAEPVIASVRVPVDPQ